MLIPRVIPCLLLSDGAMVKTRKFKKPGYVGDPINVVSLFNRFEVDEIALLDIRATVRRQPPDIELLAELAEECWVPLTYGGGVTDLRQIELIILSGVEKVVLNSAIADDMRLAEEAAKEFGSQAIVGAVDAGKRLWGGYDVYVESGRRNLGISPAERAHRLQSVGVGEILLNSITRDGERVGYDLKLIRSVTEAVDLPVIACGGAASRDQLAEPVLLAGASAAAAGSLFVHRGAERAVLVNFPERAELESLLGTQPHA